MICRGANHVIALGLGRPYHALVSAVSMERLLSSLAGETLHRVLVGGNGRQNRSRERMVAPGGTGGPSRRRVCRGRAAHSSTAALPWAVIRSLREDAEWASGVCVVGSRGLSFAWYCAR